MANYLYNGVELPDINEVWTDKETYPYAYIYVAIVKSGYAYSLYLSNKPLVNNPDDNILLSEWDMIGVRYEVLIDTRVVPPSADDKWILKSTNVSAIFIHKLSDLVWHSYDILYKDGTLFLAASSKPVPTSDPYILIKQSTIQAIANATMRKRGLTSILGVDIATEIDVIETESSPILQEKSITENGEYAPDEGYDGFSKVTVDVPASILGVFTVNNYTELSSTEPVFVGTGSIYRIMLNDNLSVADSKILVGKQIQINTSDGYHFVTKIIGITPSSKYLYIETAPSQTISQGDTIYAYEDAPTYEEVRLAYQYGYDEGRKTEHDEHWDSVQEMGSRGNHDYAFFGRGNNSVTFKPKYDIRPTSADSMFKYFGEAESDFIDLCSLLNALDVELDLSNCTNLTNTFAFSKISKLGVIDCRKATVVRSLLYQTYVDTVEELILPEATNAFYSDCFVWARNLANIKITGYFYDNVILWYTQHLTKESIISFINALSPDVTGKSITFSKININSAFATAEGLKDGSTSTEWKDLIATKPNWTIALQD
jgi:hypothetical protein